VGIKAPQGVRRSRPGQRLAPRPKGLNERRSASGAQGAYKLARSRGVSALPSDELCPRVFGGPGLQHEKRFIVVGMEWRERITVDPKILVGKPTVTGTRISVETVIDALAAGWTNQQILENYPTLKEDDIRACLSYVGDLLHGERVYALETA